MKWPLVLLLVAGPGLVLMSCHYSYHFINQRKSWSEAQKICRENFTDLATVFQLSDTNRLLQHKNEFRSDGAWIGLSHNHTNRPWVWSHPGVEFKYEDVDWHTGEPDDQKGPENCVFLRENKKFGDASCTNTFEFICYNGTTNSSIVTSNEKKTWDQAQKHCTDENMSLVSGRDQLGKVQGLKNNERYWVGLSSRGDRWRWSDKSKSNFTNCDEEPWTSSGSGDRCCFVDKSGKWKVDDCSKPKPFICYKDDLILIKQNLNWQDALDHCLEHHDDLASIASEDQQRWMGNRAKAADGALVWLGLRYSCTLSRWFRIDGDIFSPDPVPYENWNGTVDLKDPDVCSKAAAMETGGNHTWVLRPDEDKLNFVCFL